MFLTVSYTYTGSLVYQAHIMITSQIVLCGSRHLNTDNRFGLPCDWEHTFDFTALQLVQSFCSPYLKKLLEMVFCSSSSQALITCNKHIAYSILKCCWWNGKCYILHAFLLLFTRLSFVQKVLLYTLPLTCHTSKNWLHGFRCGRCGGHNPLYILLSQTLTKHCI